MENMISRGNLNFRNDNTISYEHYIKDVRNARIGSGDFRSLSHVPLYHTRNTTILFYSVFFIQISNVYSLLIEWSLPDARWQPKVTFFIFRIPIAAQPLQVYAYRFQWLLQRNKSLNISYSGYRHYGAYLNL